MKNFSKKSALIVTVTVLLGGFFIFGTGCWFGWGDGKEEGKEVVSENIEETPVPSPTEEPESENQTVPTDSPSLLYTYKRRSPELEKVYQTDIYGNNEEEVEIGYQDDDSVKFVSTRDGKYLAKYNENLLEVAPSKELNSFKEVAKTSESDTFISNVSWSLDNKKLIFVVVKLLEPGEAFGAAEKRVYIINRDGTAKRLVKKFKEPQYIVIEGFNTARDEFYWFETGEGAYVENFTVVSLVDGSIKEIKRDIDIEDDFSLNFNSDFSRAYYIKDNKIVEYSLLNNQKRIIYKLSEIGQNQNGNKSSIGSLMISSNDDFLIFTEKMEPDDKNITLSIALPEGKVETVLDDPKYYNIGPSHLSPDGKYLWFTTLCHGCGQNEDEYYVMNLDDKKIHLILKGERGWDKETGQELGQNETLHFISWIPS